MSKAWIAIMGAVIPLAIGANIFLDWLPVIVTAYNDINQVYPVFLWLDYILVSAAVVSLILYRIERSKRIAEHENAIIRLSDRNVLKLREQLHREMQVENDKITATFTAKDADFAKREKSLTYENIRIRAIEQQAQAKLDEYTKVLSDAESKTEQLNFWLSHIDCAIQALVEDHEAVNKISSYLDGWLNKATTDPTRFTADINDGRFDLKRFERTKRLLEKIYERYAEIQRELAATAKILNEGGYNALDNK